MIIGVLGLVINVPFNYVFIFTVSWAYLELGGGLRRGLGGELLVQCMFLHLFLGSTPPCGLCSATVAARSV